MMLEAGREGEEKLADPQSSLVELWTRCSFDNYTEWPSSTFELLCAANTVKRYRLL